MAAPPPFPILIAGPTGSGKSALALRLAEELGGVVINADAMQVYSELSILTARPSSADEARAPHWLYGHISAGEAYSTGRYLADAADALSRSAQEGLRPIFVGGTGLYFKALLEGLSPVPTVASDIRQYWRARAVSIGAAGLHGELAKRDPIMAQRLRQTDTQRLTRALEVLDATGRSLAYWQSLPGKPLIEEAHTIRLVRRPDRASLLEACDERFDAMMALGALDEVRRLIALNLDPALPCFGALGVAPLRRYLRGEIDLASAVIQSKRDTHHYVKRQFTWLRRHMITWNDVQTEFLERNDRSLKQFIDRFMSSA
jgi:tRNA dimethylallyltransferase